MFGLHETQTTIHVVCGRFTKLKINTMFIWHYSHAHPCGKLFGSGIKRLNLQAPTSNSLVCMCFPFTRLRRCSAEMRKCEALQNKMPTVCLNAVHVHVLADAQGTQLWWLPLQQIYKRVCLPTQLEADSQSCSLQGCVVKDRDELIIFVWLILPTKIRK